MAKRLIKDVYCFTSLDAIKISFQWSISDFSRLCHKNGENIESGIFYSEADLKSKFRISMYPNGKDENSKDYLSVFLKTGSDRDLNIKYTIAIIDIEEKEIYKNSNVL